MRRFLVHISLERVKVSRVPAFHFLAGRGIDVACIEARVAGCTYADLHPRILADLATGLPIRFRARLVPEVPIRELGLRSGRGRCRSVRRSRSTFIRSRSVLAGGLGGMKPCEEAHAMLRVVLWQLIGSPVRHARGLQLVTATFLIVLAKAPIKRIKGATTRHRGTRCACRMAWNRTTVA